MQTRTESIHVDECETQQVQREMEIQKSRNIKQVSNCWVLANSLFAKTKTNLMIGRLGDRKVWGCPSASLDPEALVDGQVINLVHRFQCLFATEPAMNRSRPIEEFVVGRLDPHFDQVLRDIIDWDIGQVQRDPVIKGNITLYSLSLNKRR